MFKRILVPLDGSQRAEQALQVATSLVQASGGSILLVRVVNTVNEFGVYSARAAMFLQEMIEQDLKDATAYLARIARSLQQKNVEVRVAVYSGQAALYILDVAREQEIDLIVLCSHGYGGLKRWVMGSVAQKVVRQSHVPVLLLREGNLQLKERLGHSLRVAVALDGSPFAEAALGPAAQLVGVLSGLQGGELHLLRLVELPLIEEEFGYMLDARFDFRSTALQDAGDYVQRVRAELQQAFPDLHISCSVEECKEVADALIQITEKGRGIGRQSPCDVLALTTHGRSGLHRWLVGSVAERVLHGSTLPLLIVHPPGVPASSTRTGEQTAREMQDESDEGHEKEQEHVQTHNRSA